MDSAGVYGLLAMDLAGVSVWGLEDGDYPGGGWGDWAAGEAESVAGGSDRGNVVAVLHGVNT